MERINFWKNQPRSPFIGCGKRKRTNTRTKVSGRGRKKGRGNQGHGNWERSVPRLTRGFWENLSCTLERNDARRWKRKREDRG